MKKLLLLGPVVLLGGALIWLAFYWDPLAHNQDDNEALALAAAPVGGPFALQSAEGPIRLSDLGGKVVLLYFGYTHCPDVCPTNLAIIALALRAMSPAERERVQVVFVSVDPTRDSLERLQEYVTYFHPDMLGATGSEQEVAATARRYGAAFRVSEQPGSAMDYTVDHSAYTYLIDADGDLAAVLDHATPAEQIVQLVRQYLPSVPNEGPP